MFVKMKLIQLVILTIETYKTSKSSMALAFLIQRRMILIATSEPNIVDKEKLDRGKESQIIYNYLGQ